MILNGFCGHYLTVKRPLEILTARLNKGYFETKNIFALNQICSSFTTTPRSHPVYSNKILFRSLKRERNF